MKIVSKAELMAMPKGILFAEYRRVPLELWTTPPTMILDSTSCDINGRPYDFFYTAFDSPLHWDFEDLIDRCDEMAERGTSYPVDLVIQREGLYDPSMRYIVWEPDDVARIINLLQGGDDASNDG